ncbi:MAG: LamG-like jellyroll fold domain-containing protein, partial [Limisphaerales bacterium]
MKTNVLPYVIFGLLTFSTVTRASLVDHWPADGDTTDLIGGNDGSATNVSYTSGQIGQAFSFDGSGQIVVDPKALAFGTDDFSLAFWIQTTSQVGAVADLCGDNTLNCALTPQGQIALAVTDTNGLNCAVVSVQHVNDGAFHHVVAERHATDLMIYVDGVLSGLSTCSGIVDLSTNYSIFTDPATNVTTTNISVATFGGNTCDDGFVGVLDDIRIYNTALDANEVYLLIHPDAKLAIVTQPFDQRTLSTHTVVFNVVGVGIEPITYQWQLNGHDIPGAVEHYYQIDSAQASDAGTYTAIVSNPYTNLTSIAATLFVTNAPSLDQYLISRYSGEGTTLDGITGVTAPYANISYGPGVLGTAFRFNEQTSVDCGNLFGPLGYGDFTYEFWIKTAYTGYAEAIMAQRAICDAAPMCELQWDATRHFVSWEFCGARESFIIATSAGIPVTLNDNVFHHVAAVRKGNAITLFIDGIRGATAAGPAADLSLLPPNLILGHSCCDYNTQVPFTGMLDEISLYNRALSDAEIFSTYQPNPSLLIVTQPRSTQAIEGMPATLSVAVNGQEPYSFQWQFEGTDILGATDSAYTMSSVPLSAAGDYSVKVSNASENVTSKLAHVTVVPANTVLPGLVNKWCAEGNASDLIGGSYLACLNASFAPGVVGQAFSFNGAGDFVSFTGIADFGANDFTVDFWEKATAGGYRVLVSRPNCYRVMDLGNDLSFELHTDVGAFSIQTSGQNIDDGQFHHIACVRQDTNLLIYVDGALSATNSFPAIGTVNTSIFGFELADDVGGPTRFAGLMDEIELYSRALSASEIAGIYSAAFNSPRAIASPKYVNTQVGNPVTLTLPPISGEGPFTYQWQLDGVNIDGQTGTTFSTSLTLDGAGVYTCVVTGPGGSTTIPV